MPAAYAALAYVAGSDFLAGILDLATTFEFLFTNVCSAIAILRGLSPLFELILFIVSAADLGAYNALCSTLPSYLAGTSPCTTSPASSFLCSIESTQLPSAFVPDTAAATQPTWR
jgi:hypothetical protein